MPKGQIGEHRTGQEQHCTHHEPTASLRGHVQQGDE